LIPGRRNNDASPDSRFTAGFTAGRLPVRRRRPGQPSLHIPAQWRAEAGPASPAEQLWWRNFHDSHLNRYVDQALKNNSDVLIARERINEYQARVYAADGSLFPSLDAGVTGARARSQSAATGLPIYSTLYKGSLTASYDVDIWGVNRSTARAAEASGGTKPRPPQPI
jgi:outer membrane protein TolC